ncbi:hypothetical protein H072_4917 [Dactylellina haptotyla CBS 200.50]|uniref:Mannosyl phosphorylinositol ceramide synthase SUR1 n=1 Tax=Dactylellina haptotyla (strain CBS 200.50) TaxID=1284197 RepID=S8BNV8_DACHA|nr:hypothetical protein H072_4917 [Dactylellina haptotyla CBS 200.50]
MRRGFVIFLVVVGCGLVFALYQVSTLISLLFEDVSHDKIPKAEIDVDAAAEFKNRPALVPKIIHQTYKTAEIPEKWLKPQKECRDLHPEYEYKLWTDDVAREFIEKEYPWFLETYDGYDHPIMRADVIRYFALRKFGGIYIDLDVGCQRKLDPLLAYPAWARKTDPTGISNDVMGATPEHPFFIRVTEVLQSYDKHWVMPYITIMASTGPLFLSIIWKKWTGLELQESARVRILMGDEQQHKPWSFFMVYKGSSWHTKDAQTIFWMQHHVPHLVIGGFILAGIIGYSVYWVMHRPRGYSKIDKGNYDA